MRSIVKYFFVIYQNKVRSFLFLGLITKKREEAKIKLTQ